MQINSGQLKAISANVAVLLSIGAEDMICALCPECGLVAFAEREAGVLLCAYCGHGPFDAEDSPKTPEAQANALELAGGESGKRLAAWLRAAAELL